MSGAGKGDPARPSEVNGNNPPMPPPAAPGLHPFGAETFPQGNFPGAPPPGLRPFGAETFPQGNFPGAPHPFFSTRRPSSSAICTAFSAAPLRRLSETHQNESPFSMVGSVRMRLM